MTLLNELNKQHKDHLYNQVLKFVDKYYFRYVVGTKFVSGNLVLDIGNKKSIHINPRLDLIVLVSDMVSHDKNYATEDNIRVLVSFFTRVFKEIEAFYNQFGHNLEGKLLKALMKPALNATDIFFQTEVQYYKSLFSGHVNNYVYNSLGIYTFNLSDGKTLHFISNGEYLTSGGIYFIQDLSKKIQINTIEPDCTYDLLAYLKELCKKPENLQNLAQPIQKSSVNRKGR